MDNLYQDLAFQLPSLGSSSFGTLESLSLGSPHRPPARRAMPRTYSAFCRHEDDATDPWRQLAAGILEPVDDAAVNDIAHKLYTILSGSKTESTISVALIGIIDKLVMRLRMAKWWELNIQESGVAVLFDNRMQYWSRFRPGRGLLIERTAVGMALNGRSQGDSCES